MIKLLSKQTLINIKFWCYIHGNTNKTIDLPALPTTVNTFLAVGDYNVTINASVWN